ncbi:hypothetical protein ACOME3_005623 [Neoechinorhynchus agilis]
MKAPAIQLLSGKEEIIDSSFAIIRLDKRSTKPVGEQDRQTFLLINKYSPDKHSEREKHLLKEMVDRSARGDYFGIGFSSTDDFVTKIDDQNDCRQLTLCSEELIGTDNLREPKPIDIINGQKGTGPRKFADDQREVSKPVIGVVKVDIDTCPVSFNPETERIKATKIMPRNQNRSHQTNHRKSLDLPDQRSFEHMTMSELTDMLIDRICYLNDGILAINKPYGLSTIGGPGIKKSVTHAFPYLADRLASLHIGK